MKKEVIKVSDGKEFVENIEKILQQAQGNYVYLDDEIVNHFKDAEMDLGDYYLVSDDEYEIFTGPTNNGLTQLKCVNRFLRKEIYESPNPGEHRKQILIILE